MAVQHVLLLSDQEHRKVALRPIAKKDKRSYSVAFGHINTGASVSCRGFLTHLGWEGKKHNVPATWNEEQAILEFQLPEWGKAAAKQKVVPVGRPKAS